MKVTCKYCGSENNKRVRETYYRDYLESFFLKCECGKVIGYSAYGDLDINNDCSDFYDYLEKNNFPDNRVIMRFSPSKSFN